MYNTILFTVLHSIEDDQLTFPVILLGSFHFLTMVYQVDLELLTLCCDQFPHYTEENCYKLLITKT